MSVLPLVVFVVVCSTSWCCVLFIRLWSEWSLNLSSVLPHCFNWYAVCFILHFWCYTSLFMFFLIFDILSCFSWCFFFCYTLYAVIDSLHYLWTWLACYVCFNFLKMKIHCRGWWIQNICQLHCFPGSNLWRYCRSLPYTGKVVCWQVYLSRFTFT